MTVNWEAGDFPSGFIPPNQCNGVRLPSGIFIPKELPFGLIEALTRLIYPRDWGQVNPQGASGLTLAIRAGTAYEFLVKRFGVAIPDWKSQAQEKQSLDLLDSLSDLWTATWDMLDWLASHHPEHRTLPSLELEWLVNESTLVLPFTGFSKYLTSTSAYKIQREIQNQNFVLIRYGNNPFSAKEYPHTTRIVKAALKISHTNMWFHSEKLMPVLKARRRCVTVNMGCRPKFYDEQGRMERRGIRRKKRKLPFNLVWVDSPLLCSKEDKMQSESSGSGADPLPYPVCLQRGWLIRKKCNEM